MRPLSKLFRLLPGIAAMVAVNVAGDPANLRGRDAVAVLARQSLTEAVPYALSTFEDRQFQVARAETDYWPEVLVLGSSRATQVDSACFPGKQVYTAAVSSGDLPDMAGILRAYHKFGKKPSLLVLGVDPFHLKENDQRYWVEVAPSYHDWLLSVGLTPPLKVWLAEAEWHLRIPLQTLSPYTFRSAVEALRQAQSKEPRESPVWKAVDGSRVKSTEPRRNRGEILAEALRRSMRELPDFNLAGVEPGRADILAALLDGARRDGIETRIFLAPFHPVAYKRLENPLRGRKLTETETFIRKLAVEHGTPVIGSYSPARSGVSGTEFYDGFHPRPSAVARVFASSNDGTSVHVHRDR